MFISHKTQHQLEIIGMGKEEKKKDSQIYTQTDLKAIATIHIEASSTIGLDVLLARVLRLQQTTNRTVRTEKAEKAESRLACTKHKKYF